MAMIGGKDKAITQVCHFKVPCKAAVGVWEFPYIRRKKYRLYMNLELQGQPVFMVVSSGWFQIIT